EGGREERGGGGKEDPSSEAAVEPASEEEKEQRRHDDGPAEHPDLAEPRAERRFGICATCRVSLDGSLRSSCQAIEIGSSHRKVGAGMGVGEFISLRAQACDDGIAAHDAASRSMRPAEAGLGRRYRIS